MSTQKPKKQKRAQETKERLLAAGYELFSEHGFHGINSKQIAKKAGVSIGNFYNYFPNKKALILELIEVYVLGSHSEVMHFIRSLEFGKRPASELMHTLVMYIYDTHQINPGFHLELLKLQTEDEEIEKLLTREAQLIRELVATSLTNHAALLRVKNIDAAARVIIAAMEQIIHELIFKGNSDKNHPLLTELTDMVTVYLFKPNE